jgi:hypothetical protein
LEGEVLGAICGGYAVAKCPSPRPSPRIPGRTGERAYETRLGITGRLAARGGRGRIGAPILNALLPIFANLRPFVCAPHAACRAPAYAPWSIAKARNGVPRPRNRAGGVAALAQQSGLLPHDREDRPRLPPVALYHTFELGAPIRRHAQTIDDEVFDPVHVVVPGQAPIDSDRPGC